METHAQRDIPVNAAHKESLLGNFNSQLAISGQCTFPDRFLLDERIGDLATFGRSINLVTESTPRGYE